MSDPRIDALAGIISGLGCEFTTEDLEEAITFARRYDALRAYDAAQEEAKDLCLKDGDPCYVPGDDGHWRCGTVRCGRAAHPPIRATENTYVCASCGGEHGAHAPSCKRESAHPQPSPRAEHKSAPPLAGADLPWLDDKLDELFNAAFARANAHCKTTHPMCEEVEAALREGIGQLLDFAARQPRPITAAEIEAATIALCCGKECDAANACAGLGLSPGGYADRYGCGSADKRSDAIAALEAAERVRVQQP